MKRSHGSVSTTSVLVKIPPSLRFKHRISSTLLPYVSLIYDYFLESPNFPMLKRLRSVNEKKDNRRPFQLEIVKRMRGLEESSSLDFCACFFFENTDYLHFRYTHNINLQILPLSLHFYFPKQLQSAIKAVTLPPEKQTLL